MNLSENKYPLSMATRFYLVCLIFLFSAFANTQIKKDQIVSIDLEKAIKSRQVIYLSQIVDKLDCVPLDLTSESTLGQRINIKVTADFIIVANSVSSSDRQLKVFDRKTGKFLRGIGQIGEGPEEYYSPSDNFYNEYDNQIYTRGNNSIKIYNLEGKFLESFNVPMGKESSTKNEEIRVGINAFLNAGTFACFVSTEGGEMRNRICIFNRNEVIKWSYPVISQPANFSREKYAAFQQDPIFYSWDGKLYAKIRSNDTVFIITAAGLSPHIVINTGDHRWPPLIPRSNMNLGNYFQIYSVYESADFLFFEFRFKSESNSPGYDFYLCIYDKKTADLKVTRNDELPIPVLIDDINGFMPISPVYVNDKNEVIAVLQATDIINWKRQNQSKASSLQKKYTWLSTINELDNPVIVIGKCKH
jgi:hypothetical protein